MGSINTQAFLAALPHGTRAQWAKVPELEAVLEAFIGQARAAFPTLNYDAHSFMSHLAARLLADAALELIRGRVSADLYLAWACLRGQRPALELLDKEVLARAVGSAARVDSSGEFLNGGVLSGMVLGALESHVQGEGSDGSTEPAKETHAGHVGFRSYGPAAPQREVDPLKGAFLRRHEAV